MRSNVRVLMVASLAALILLAGGLLVAAQTATPVATATPGEETGTPTPAPKHETGTPTPGAELETPTPTPAAGQVQTPEAMTPMTRTVSVVGSGSVMVTPDLATIQVGVETQAESAQEAISQNSTTMQDVISAVQEAGVAEEDIQTAFVQLRPQYQQPEPGPMVQGPGEVVGYIASNTVQVTVRNLDDVGTILDAAVTAGANQVFGISLQVSEPTEVMDEARNEAWDSAMVIAQQYAELAGATLGAVVSINEGGTGVSPVFEAAALGRGGAGVPIEPGQQTVQVTVQVTWLLE